MAQKRYKKRAELKAPPKRKYYKSRLSQFLQKVKEERTLKTEDRISIKLGVIIGAFLYALSEMYAGHIHWAVGDLILVALWMGGKSVFADLRMHLKAKKLFEKMQAEAKRKEAA